MLEKKDKEILKENELLSNYSSDLFRNKEGKIIRADELSFIGAGENATVWKYKDEAFKIFFDYYYSCGLSNEIYSKMKELPLKRILKAKDTYECINYTGERRYWDGIDAYLMDYTEKIEGETFLDIPTSILLENIHILEEDVKTLSENGIQMVDLSANNSIINSNYEVYLCDTDMYKFFNSSEVEVEKILEINKMEFNNFIRNSVERGLRILASKEELSFDECLRQIQLFDWYSPLDKDTYNGLEELFGNYDKQKEYYLSIE